MGIFEDVRKLNSAEAVIVVAAFAIAAAGFSWILFAMGILTV